VTLVCLKMSPIHRIFLPLALSLLCGFFGLPHAASQTAQAIDTSAENLMVVLRESFGANKQDEKLIPFGKLRTRLDDGREIDFQMAAFEFLGDMHIRFVFDAPNFMRVAKPEDLVRLNLSPEAALQLAVSNIKRVYGRPVATPSTAGLMQVDGQSPDLISSYFLDREFWEELLKEHPEGLVAAVPKRGGLLFAPRSDFRAVRNLQKGVAYLHSSSERLRVSSAVYLFKDHHWTVFQAPVPTHQ